MWVLFHYSDLKLKYYIPMLKFQTNMGLDPQSWYFYLIIWVWDLGNISIIEPLIWTGALDLEERGQGHTGTEVVGDSVANSSTTQQKNCKDKETMKSEILLLRLNLMPSAEWFRVICVLQNSRRLKRMQNLSWPEGPSQGRPSQEIAAAQNKTRQKNKTCILKSVYLRWKRFRNWGN